MSLLTRIPHAPTAADGQPLKRCIRKAAQEMGVSDFLAAKIMCHFFMQLAEEVAGGECITISGIGRFGAGILKSDTDEASVFPQFYPSRAFRNELKAVLTVAGALKSNDRMQSYRRSHRAGSRKNDTSRPFTALMSVIEQLDAMEERQGGSIRD